MILSLSLKNTPKHHGCFFSFKEGINLIKGENESGKSSLLEYIDFALHGSVALRLPVSMYPTNLQADLVFQIKGQVYWVRRTPKKSDALPWHRRRLRFLFNRIWCKASRCRDS